MKNLVIVFVVLCFCFMGYLIKQKYKNQKEFLMEVKDFLEYFKANMSVLNNSVVEIINSYKIIQNNKNAKCFNLFQNNENLVKFNAKTLEKYIYNENLAVILKNYFEDFGSKTHDFELEKLNNVLGFLGDSIQKTEEEIKSKGDIWFKILIAIGLVFAIVLW